MGNQQKVKTTIARKKAGRSDHPIPLFDVAPLKNNRGINFLIAAFCNEIY
jgi:hypothetical protein